ncbi:hypothetical protein SODALDRAFT_63409 [Sodiomyces alkalinus F11]|uniref:DUF8032 domain-containing protein n=1 Tax=Sodiomyces alkalinus (strain CBS 110278 / VKM F-3762 / F11) TaxID=1314773 RepID=A0A3N2PLR9_SODAK|nr:hypothetical protein SODALDRAFT_63409 [Sodiomyces alkalinus F11]ROT35360.1 hypothetical protein SODALDRAFT_63409 [Sodiomyces alkalinus F11]
MSALSARRQLGTRSQRKSAPRGLEPDAQNLLLPSLVLQHPPHHQQGPAPHQHLQRQSHPQHQHPRSSSIGHPQHHSQQPSQSQNPPAYTQGHSITSPYSQPAAQANAAQSAQDGLPYYTHPSPYSTPGATSGYTSADTSDMMAAAQMPRPPYPPMSYHTPQSNSPASVASPSQHDQHRSIYAQPPSQHLPQNMYYQTHQAHYQTMQPQPQQSPYAQHAHAHAQAQAHAHGHAHAAHPHQSMSSQQSMMMSQGQQQPQMHQQSSQHHPQQQQQQHQQQQQAQPQMTNSPRHVKQEPQSQVPLQLQKPQPPPMGHSPHPPNGSAMSTPTGSTSGGVNPNAAPGPIPATTPLVVRQDQNGVQWIAFEYSRDRVKMEYTIRCDVESVNTDELSQEFKTENCVYPRACVPKDLYRGNRQVYETECNTVGWALAQLNPSLRGKRGLIQRAVDSWRNSNQDPRLRSRRVRRQAKMNTRKASQQAPHQPQHMGGPSPPGMPPTPGAMGPGQGPSGSAKMPGMASMGHMGHGGAQGGADEVGMFHQM